MNSFAASTCTMRGLTSSGSPTKPRSTTRSIFEFGIDLRSCQFFRYQEIAILAGDAAGVAAKLVDLADDLLVDRARENHLDHFHRRRVGHAKPAGELALDAQPAEQTRDLRSAAMHHDRLHARLFEHDDVAGEAFGKLRVDHGVAAIFDDHRRLIVALHIGQRLGEDLRRDAGFSAGSCRSLR